MKMPGKPTEKKQTVKTAAGKDLNVMTVFAEGRTDALFVVSYTDYPEADLKKGSVEKRLDYARDGAAASVGGKVVNEKAKELKGYAGREFAVQKNGEIVARMPRFSGESPPLSSNGARQRTGGDGASFPGLVRPK